MLHPTWVKVILICLFQRKIRLELLGYRPEVICIVRSIGSEDKYLVVAPAANHDIWMPPQEGIHPEETIENASVRCLQMELGLAESVVQFRKSTWVAKRQLPQSRWDERDLRYSLRRILGGPSMVGKAYFAALVLVDPAASIRRNPAEISDYAWVSEQEFDSRIRTNRRDKENIIREARRALE